MLTLEDAPWRFVEKAIEEAKKIAGGCVLLLDNVEVIEKYEMTLRGIGVEFFSGPFGENWKDPGSYYCALVSEFKRMIKEGEIPKDRWLTMVYDGKKVWIEQYLI
ncbi:MAG: hypothetical protein GXO63_00860 [Candidatus Micrarchaeota archaeon]|nr:hypothetical protein [Candidatus Micrarchaeota archaeon]